MEVELLYSVPYRLLCKYRLDRGLARYVCEDVTAQLVPVDCVLAPVLSPAIAGLEAQRLDAVLRALARGIPLAPLVVARRPATTALTLVSGLHRFYAARAARVAQVPAVFVSRA